MIPQRCCPAWATLRTISERVETHPLLRLSLAILTVGSLLSIAIVNLVGSGLGCGEAGPARTPCCAHCLLEGASLLPWGPPDSRLL